MNRRARIAAPAIVAIVSLLPGIAAAQAATAAPNDWAWRFGLNLWLPSIKSTTQFELPGGDNIHSEADPGGYLKKLKFVFMGTIEARHGPWSILGDVVQLHLSDDESKVTSISGPGGGVTVPIDTGSRTDLKGFVTTIEGGYAVQQSRQARMDLVAGVRYARLKAGLDWNLSGPTGGVATSGNVESTKDFWDGVVGVRGRADLGGNWDFRYYVDAGAGSSKLTWQALGGVGYRFGWGDAILSYRHLAYELHGDRPISDMKFSGPQFVIGWTF
jgi:hypothetical protein